AANGVWNTEILRERKQLRIAPHVEGAADEFLAADNFLEGSVIVGDFERREAVFTERAGDVTPDLAAFATSEFVKRIGAHIANSSVFSVFSVPRRSPAAASTEQPNHQLTAIDQLRFRAAGRRETKNPPCQSARRVSENLLGNSKSSLAVFYVEQVALNRHVSPQPQLCYLCLSRWQMSRAALATKTESED